MSTFVGTSIINNHEFKRKPGTPQICMRAFKRLGEACLLIIGRYYDRKVRHTALKVRI